MVNFFNFLEMGNLYTSCLSSRLWGHRSFSAPSIRRGRDKIVTVQTFASYCRRKHSSPYMSIPS